jgi:hypothetical protein
MDRHEGPQTALTLALLLGVYIAIKMERHEGTQTAQRRALLGGLYLAIILGMYQVP